ncbi:MAG TPA: class I SAM-dependent methyltransferase [Dongiaceae bacterium]|jgi:SAM-dependent methyltransferase
MSDAATLDAYAKGAAGYSADWLAQPAPDDLYELLATHFRVGGATADIGCGNGRDAAWLAANGYPTTGFDGSPALLAEARRHHPKIAFQTANLPALGEITATFDNVVCETVIMHLPVAQIPVAVNSLKRIIRSGGVLYLSWRVTEGADVRDAAGRLYSAFPASLVTDPLQDCTTLHFADTTSLSSGKRICRIVARKS